MRRPPAPPLPKPVWAAVGNWFFPLLLSSFVIAWCVAHDSTRRLWPDEILAWYPANASFRTMLTSTADTINGAPPVYFILAWLWSVAFGKSTLVLRLFSALATGTAICVMSVVLRRAYGRLAAAAGLLAGFIDAELLSYSVQIRFHTLMAAEVALGILLYQRIVAQQRPSTRLLIGNVCVHAALVLTQYLGFLYSGAILAAFVLTGWARGGTWVRASLSVVAGWLAFVPWIPIFIRHSSMAKPSVWIPVPSLKSLKAFYANIWAEFSWLATGIVAVALAGMLVLTLVTLFKDTPPVAVQRRAVRPRELPLLIVGTCILLIPLVVYFLSVRSGGTSLFLPRYFLPCVLGSSIFFAHTASRAIVICARIPERLPRQAVLTLLAAVLAAKYLHTGIDSVHAMKSRGIGVEPRPADFPADRAPGEPIVIEHIHEYLKMVFYSGDPLRYVYALDPAVGLADGRGGKANHQIIAAMARQFPADFGSSRSTEDFLASTDKFWIKRAVMMHWYSMRIEHNPLFAVDRRENNGTLLHVHRIH